MDKICAKDYFVSERSAMELEIGDIVQVTGILPGRNARKHPCYEMIGTVVENSDSKKISVYFLQDPLYKHEVTKLQYFIFYFSSDEITKIGKAAIPPDVRTIIDTEKFARDAYLAAHPDFKALIEETQSILDHRDKFKQLQPGSPEAQAQGCVCSDIRNLDCILHAMTVGEMIKLQDQAESVLDGLEDKTD